MNTSKSLDYEKQEFLDSVRYFWFEKGDVERMSGFSNKRLREIDPALAFAYEQMVISREVFSRLLKEGNDE